MIADRFGRKIEYKNDLYCIDGVNVRATDFEHAISIFDGMAPDWWEEPKVQQPLDKFGVMATLNVVLELWTLEDAANAVGLQPEDLIAEAEAWAVAQQGYDAV